MSVFSPKFAGTVTIHTPATEFLDRFERRVEAGLLTGKPHWRARYAVTRRSGHELSFRASSFVTAINVGLNEVDLRIPADKRLEYVVTYGKWAAYCVAFSVGLGALLGGALIACFFFVPTMRDDIAAKDGAAIFWGSVVFWGFVWPWVLAALLVPLQKASARRLLNRLIDEVDMQADHALSVGCGEG